MTSLVCLGAQFPTATGFSQGIAAAGAKGLFALCKLRARTQPRYVRRIVLRGNRATVSS